MSSDRLRPSDTPRPTAPGWWVSAAPAVLAALGLVAAACGGGGTPTVAHLGTTTTTTAAAASAASNSGPSLAQANRYAQCMRSHGITNYPDPSPMPGGQGSGFKITGLLNGDKSQLQAAENACGHLLPNQGVNKPLTAQQQAFLDWAACIRAHGLPNFADPEFNGGGVSLRVTSGMGSPDSPSPQFQAAQRACRSKLPAGFGGLGG